MLPSRNIFQLVTDRRRQLPTRSRLQGNSFQKCDHLVTKGRSVRVEFCLALSISFKCRSMGYQPTAYDGNRLSIANEKAEKSESEILLCKSCQKFGSWTEIDHSDTIVSLLAFFAKLFLVRSKYAANFIMHLNRPNYTVTLKWSHSVYEGTVFVLPFVSTSCPHQTGCTEGWKFMKNHAMGSKTNESTQRNDVTHFHQNGRYNWKGQRRMLRTFKWGVMKLLIGRIVKYEWRVVWFTERSHDPVALGVFLEAVFSAHILLGDRRNRSKRIYCEKQCLMQKLARNDSLWAWRYQIVKKIRANGPLIPHS